MPLLATITTIAALAVIVLGASLRIYGLTTCELWADEAWWANKLIEGEVAWIRPPAYMWLTRLIIDVVNTEATLRSLSLVSALVQLPLFYLLMRRVVAQPWVAVAATFLLAVHPSAVGLAKEFKPYALESLLHTALLLLAVSYVAKPRTALVAALAVVAAAAPPFSWSTVFLYPSVFLVVGMRALSERRRADVAVAIIGVVATLAILGTVFALRLKNANPHPEYWGGAYGVFYLGDSVVDGLAWYLKKTAQLFALPGALRMWWGALPRTEPISIALGVTGLVVVIVRTWRARAAAPARVQSVTSLLFVLPWLVFLAFNIAGQWPYGVFRTNLFMVVYAIALAALGLDALAAYAKARWPKRGGPVVVVVSVLLLAQALPVRPIEFRCKGAGSMALNSSVRRALRIVHKAIEVNGAADPRTLMDLTLALDGQACSVLTYYRAHHDRGREELRWLDDKGVTLRCSTGRGPGFRTMLDEVVAQPGSFYAVINTRGSARYAHQRMQELCTTTAERKLSGTRILWCGRGDTPIPPIARSVAKPVAKPVDTPPRDGGPP